MALRLRIFNSNKEFQVNNYPPILLASQSPRRHDLMKMAGFEFRVHSADVEEVGPAHLSVYELTEHIARIKVEAVISESKPEELIVSADTIVLLNNKILGKPKDRNEAREFLQRLSGTTHDVITAVCLHKGDKSLTFSETTVVHFKKLSSATISKYIATDEPYDKAGGYAIQGPIGLRSIEKINGCFFNVMGLPVSRLIDELDKF